MKTLKLISFALLLHGLSSGQTKIDSTRIVFDSNDPIDREGFEIQNVQLFKPTLSQITIADNTAQAFLLDTAKLKELYWDTIFNDGWTMRPPFLEFKEYYKQYVGLIENGSRVILINGLGFKKDYFSTKMAFPAGGGSYYFRIKVLVDPPKVIDMRTNAPL